MQLILIIEEQNVSQLVWILSMERNLLILTRDYMSGTMTITRNNQSVSSHYEVDSPLHEFLSSSW
jgi:hypothetical protein